ncbi:hypothetical protein [Ferroplasma sp.]|uniref:hypothetical protein n=1 Tax=Ferroplasma sp. TaxID=2591003 RepID=UPI002625830B|nr:hypothetical protein [Ferroplasma sp.]
MKHLTDGKPVVMYYSKSPNLSNLHTTIQSEEVGILNELCITITGYLPVERGAFGLGTDFFIVKI